MVKNRTVCGHYDNMSFSIVKKQTNEHTRKSYRIMSSNKDKNRIDFYFLDVIWRSPTGLDRSYPCSTRLPQVLELVLFKILGTFALSSEPAHPSTSFERNHCNQGWIINGGRCTINTNLQNMTSVVKIPKSHT